MLACALLVSIFAVAQASRLLPELSGWSWHSADARGAFGTSGAFPIPVQTLSALHAARDEEAEELPFYVVDSGPSFVAQPLVDFGGRTVIDADLDQELDNRYSDHGGAAAELWRVHRSPMIVKRLWLDTEQDRVVAENQLSALLTAEFKDVLLTIAELWTRYDDGFEREVVITKQAYAGTLRTLIGRYKGRLDVLTALDFFIEIADQLRKLRHGGTAIDAPTKDEVLIAGDLNNIRTCRIVLLSSLVNSDVRLQSTRVALGRLLNFQPSDDSAVMRSTREVKAADMKCLNVLFADLLDLIRDAEVEAFLSMALKLEMTDGDPDGTLDHICERAGALRTGWIEYLWLKKIVPKERPETGNFLGAIFKPKGVQADHGVADAILESIERLEEADSTGLLADLYAADADLAAESSRDFDPEALADTMEESSRDFTEEAEAGPIEESSRDVQKEALADRVEQSSRDFEEEAEVDPIEESSRDVQKEALADPVEQSSRDFEEVAEVDPIEESSRDVEKISLADSHAESSRDLEQEDQAEPIEESSRDFEKDTQALEEAGVRDRLDEEDYRDRWMKAMS